MRLKIRDGAVGESTGGRVTGPLHLFRDPLLPLEGATKRYVDAIPNNLSASLITSGTLRNNMLPAWNGEVTTTAGGRVITIKNTVAANTYQSVNVNTKGLVVGGGPLVVGDIPNLNWSKISKGRPISLAGYGITDGVNLNGGSLTGSLVLSRQPVLNNEVATKKYSDDIGMLTSLNTGDIIRKITNVTPVGFLKCNGGGISKEMYADLYSVIGDVFYNGDYKGYGHHWRLQHGVSEVEVSGRLAWSPNVVSLPRTTFQYGLAVGKGRIYIIAGATGGQNGVGYNTVFSAPVDNNGIIGDWVSEPNLPAPRHTPAVCLVNNFLYVIGGWHNDAGHRNVYRAKVNEDGTLGVWNTLPVVPEGSYGRTLLVIKNKLVIIGGNYRTHHYADLNEDGSIGIWTKGTNLLPAAQAYSSTFIVKDKLYVLGSANTSVYVSNIQTDGTLGEFTVANTLPVNPSISDVAVINDRVYVFTGRATGDVYSATTNPDGTISNWTLDSSVGLSCSGHRVVIVKNRIYSIGGDGGKTGTRYCSITGGTNDYSTWYDANYINPDNDLFYLPDINLNNQPKINAFIKY